MSDALPLQISEKTGKPVTDVKKAIIWGNHSSTQYPDVNHGTVGGQPIRQVVKDDEWLNGEFISTVQQRGATIIKASHLSCSLQKPCQSTSCSSFIGRHVIWPQALSQAESNLDTLLPATACRQSCV